MRIHYCGEDEIGHGDHGVKLKLFGVMSLTVGVETPDASRHENRKSSAANNREAAGKGFILRRRVAPMKDDTGGG